MLTPTLIDRRQKQLADTWLAVFLGVSLSAGLTGCGVETTAAPNGQENLAASALSDQEAKAEADFLAPVGEDDKVCLLQTGKSEESVLPSEGTESCFIGKKALVSALGAQQQKQLTAYETYATGYADIYYRGSKIKFLGPVGGSCYTLWLWRESFPPAWNDRISSIWASHGCSAVLYQNVNFGGRSATCYSGQCAAFPFLNDAASSIVLRNF